VGSIFCRRKVMMLQKALPKVWLRTCAKCTDHSLSLSISVWVLWCSYWCRSYCRWDGDL
jgi:hypothetical protein